MVAAENGGSWQIDARVAVQDQSSAAAKSLQTFTHPVTQERKSPLLCSKNWVLNREGAKSLEKSSFRVLVVDDYEPFRRFVCSRLGKNPELQIVGEASDGLEAVHKPKNCNQT